MSEKALPLHMKWTNLLGLTTKRFVAFDTTITADRAAA
jgi:hypothetical protein